MSEASLSLSSPFIPWGPRPSGDDHGSNKWMRDASLPYACRSLSFTTRRSREPKALHDPRFTLSLRTAGRLRPPPFTRLRLIPEVKRSESEGMREGSGYCLTFPSFGSFFLQSVPITAPFATSVPFSTLRSVPYCHSLRVPSWTIVANDMSVEREKGTRGRDVNNVKETDDEVRPKVGNS